MTGHLGPRALVGEVGAGVGCAPSAKVHGSTLALTLAPKSVTVISMEQ